MTMICVKGVHFENRGAELMLLAILKHYNASGQSVKVCMNPSAYAPYPKRARLGLYQFFSLSKGTLDLNFLTYFIPKKLRSFLSNHFGIVLEADVDLFLEASGFNLGDQWPLKNAAILARLTKRLKKKGKKIVYMPQAMGPFTRPEERTLIKSILNDAALFYCRDDVTMAYAKEIVGSSTLHQCPDFTVSEDYDSETKENRVVVIPNSNMTSSRNVHAGLWQENYISTLVEMSEAFSRQGVRVVLLNHEGKSDRVILDSIAKELGERGIEIQIEDALGANQIKQLLSQSKFAVSSRFHGCVSALSTGTICFGTSWSHKYEELYKLYDSEDLLLKPEADKELIQQSVDRVISDSDALQKRLAERKRDHLEKVKDMWREIDSLKLGA